MEFRPGVAERFMTGLDLLDRPLDVTLAGGADHQGDTSYIAVVDQARNPISFTPSLHSSFGSKVVLGDLGFILNCRGDYYSFVPGHANALARVSARAARSRVRLVMKDGKPFLVTGGQVETISAANPADVS